ncbi:MAG: hypothetical protein DMG92_14200, partial [Acidobacteria bacterium]
MAVDRRQFLANSAKAAAAAKLLPEVFGFAQGNSPQLPLGDSAQKPYGSGYFGTWIEDEYGLPAFHYTCDQVHDPRAMTEINPGLLLPT